MKGTLAAVPKLQKLHLFRPVMSGGLLLPDFGGPPTKKELLPLLRRLHLESIVYTRKAGVPSDFWRPEDFAHGLWDTLKHL